MAAISMRDPDLSERVSANALTARRQAPNSAMVSNVLEASSPPTGLRKAPRVRRHCYVVLLSGEWRPVPLADEMISPSASRFLWAAAFA